MAALDLPPYPRIRSLLRRPTVSSPRPDNFLSSNSLYFRPNSPLRYARVEWLFLRLLALIYFIAFASLGSRSPAWWASLASCRRRFLAATRKRPARAYWLAPGVFWIAHSDRYSAACVGRGRHFPGAAVGVWSGRRCPAVRPVSFALLHRTKLSGLPVGHVAARSRFSGHLPGSSKAMVFLFRWLLFRLMFLSGAVKLLSHDPTWRSERHEISLPDAAAADALAWYMYQLPSGSNAPQPLCS